MESLKKGEKKGFKHHRSARLNVEGNYPGYRQMGTIFDGNDSRAFRIRCHGKKNRILRKNIFQHIGTIDFRYFLVYNYSFSFLEKLVGRQTNVIRSKDSLELRLAHLNGVEGLLSKCTKYRKNKGKALCLEGYLLTGAFIRLRRRYFGGRHEIISKVCGAISSSFTTLFNRYPGLWGTQC